MPRRRPGRRPVVPPDAVVALLGVVHDKDLARQAGVSDQTIARWRKTRGIAAVPTPPRDSRSAQAVAWLAQHPGTSPTDAAHRFGLRGNTIYQKQKRDEQAMADKLKPTLPTEVAGTAIFRCKITEGRYVEMRLPTSKFTQRDADRIQAFLATLVDE